MASVAPASDRATALGVVQEQLAEATAAKKCHACGCFHGAVASFERTSAGSQELAGALAQARAVLTEKRYDCLGCEVCFPAIAENAFAEAFPGEASAPLCPTDAPVERTGWPPLPGDYRVLRYRAPVAVCALHSADLAAALAAGAPRGLAIAGTLHTENLGIERIIRNVLANPHLRFLVLCGEDAQQAIGHLPGQSLLALLESGLDEKGRIRGARGKRPVLKNVLPAQVDAFRRQVEIASMIGQLDLDAIAAQVETCAARDPGPFDGAPSEIAVATVAAHEPARLVLDPAGFLVVYPDRTRGLVLEHYRNDGVLDCVVEGATPAAVGATAAERGLVSRLDHAIYLGRELARAEESLRTGLPYVQDRAPEAGAPLPAQDCGCEGGT